MTWQNGAALLSFVVNVAGGLEVALGRAAVRTGLRPALLLASVTGVLSLILYRWCASKAPPFARPDH